MAFDQLLKHVVFIWFAFIWRQKKSFCLVTRTCSYTKQNRSEPYLTLCSSCSMMISIPKNNPKTKRFFFAFFIRCVFLALSVK